MEELLQFTGEGEARPILLSILGKGRAVLPYTPHCLFFKYLSVNPNPIPTPIQHIPSHLSLADSPSPSQVALSGWPFLRVRVLGVLGILQVPPGSLLAAACGDGCSIVIGQACGGGVSGGMGLQAWVWGSGWCWVVALCCPNGGRPPRRMGPGLDLHRQGVSPLSPGLESPGPASSRDQRNVNPLHPCTEGKGLPSLVYLAIWWSTMLHVRYT